MNNKTPLHANHLSLSARMVEFSGWEMPLHYGSQLEEHHAVRQHAGMFDVSHMTVLDISGSGSEAFLCELLANDIRKLRDSGMALYSCMLDEAGGVIDDLIAYRLADSAYRLVVNAGTRDKDIAWIQERAGRFDVSILERSELAMIAVQGPAARDLVHQALPAEVASELSEVRRFSFVDHAGYFVARTGYTGEDGYELILSPEHCVALWTRLHELGVRPVGLGARDTLRLEAGMALYGNDLDEQHSPLDSGLAWTVGLSDDRDFVGKSRLTEQTQNGSSDRMIGLILEGRGILRHGQKLFAGEEQIGEITSGTFSPTLQESIGLARIDGEVTDTCDVDIRGKRLPARVVNYPFVIQGQSSR